jgi:radical SAM protein with 4Fe4S-binding SPASM domain
LGVKRLCLLGGEPFLFDGWQAIAEAASTLGLAVDFVSCGIGISEQTISGLLAARVHWVTISVDGTEAVHEQSRRVPGGYREALEAIRKLDDAGLKVGVTTQLNRRTLSTLPALAGELQDAGAFGWQLQLTLPTGRAKERPEVLLAPEDMPDVFSKIRALRKRVGLSPHITDDIGYMTFDDPQLRTPSMCPERCFCGCLAGLRTVGITSFGDVKGCLSLPDELVEGNVRDESLEAIWGDPNRFSYNRSYDESSLSKRCQTCELSRACRGGCTSVSVAATGKPNQGTFCVRPREIVQ